MAKLLRNEPYSDDRGRSHNVRVVECPNCRSEVYCYDFTNTCRCGADFNMSGTFLAPRCQWGEETGETASDILNAEAAGFPDLDD